MSCLPACMDPIVTTQLGQQV